ncbi:hypothetical protein [Nocardia flavorosea]|uniref:hypothetical protein n=1 Tax=Nocardia flavorosea TaxID=53429 RepID=UPI002457C2B3|nr:hypothetical protein [Nocardia flavorosea]
MTARSADAGGGRAGGGPRRGRRGRPGRPRRGGAGGRGARDPPPRPRPHPTWGAGGPPGAGGRPPAVAAGWAPPTAEAVVELLKHHGIALEGRHVAIVGRSNVVGKPLAQLLLAENATVTVCHSRTTDLPAVTAAADIVVAAAGRIGLVTGANLRPGAVVIDVGTNESADGSIVGDVDPESVRGTAAGLSPVPGGVGPVTTALLMRHVVIAAEQAGRTADTAPA